MKSYQYVNIKLWKFLGASLEDHRQIIDEYAAQGYRYVGYIPTNMDAHGVLKEIDLIFEKDV